MLERKTVIWKIQQILNDHYNIILEEDNDEIRDANIDLFNSIQRGFDELYKKWGYEFKDEYDLNKLQEVKE